MPTRNIVLTDRQAKLIERLVSSGQYQNASEVLRDGLRLVEDRATEQKAKLKALRAAIKVGTDDLETGRFRRFKTPEDLRAYLRALADDAIRSGRSKIAAE